MEKRFISICSAVVLAAGTIPFSSLSVAAMEDSVVEKDGYTFQLWNYSDATDGKIDFEPNTEGCYSAVWSQSGRLNMELLLVLHESQDVYMHKARRMT